MSNGSRAGATLLALIVFAVAGRRANATPNVRPVVDCVADDGQGRFTAVFGYVNSGKSTVNIPVGSGNKIDDGLNPINRRQPTSFKKGRSTPVTDGTRVPFSGTVTWTLDGQTATATHASPKCSKNLAPVVLDKFLRMKQGEAGEFLVDLSIDALDPEGQSMRLLGVGKPAHGTVTSHGLALRYSPSASFFGTDEFGYTVGDSSGSSSSGTILVAVEPLAVVNSTAAKCDKKSCICIEGAKKPFNCEDIHSRCEKVTKSEPACLLLGGVLVCLCEKSGLSMELLF